MTTLSAHQEKAVSTVVSRIKGLISPEPLTYVGGYAGTGKSTILPHILEAVGFQPETITFCAPTGKAAKVMRQKLRAQQYPNSNAVTIHSAIYRAKPVPIAQLESDLTRHEGDLLELQLLHRNEPRPSLEHDILVQKKLVATLREELEAAYREDKIHFQLNPDAAIQLSNLIVVDEASMVGRHMTDHLMSFGVPILAMGDPGQLPPVEDDPGLTAGAPDFFLTEIHRQARDNPIIHLSQLAREGKDLPIGKYGTEAEVMKRKDYDPVLSVDDRPMFLVGMNKTRWRINQMLRAEFGVIEHERDKLGPQAGEPLIVCKNSKDNPNLVNGTECTALTSVEMHEGDSKFQMSFEDNDEGVTYTDKQVFQGLFEEHFSRRGGGFSCAQSSAYRARRTAIQMDWAYAITVHKSQGSQWDNVVVIDESHVFRDDCDKHLYTAVTRAAKTLKVLI